MEVHAKWDASVPMFMVVTDRTCDYSADNGSCASAGYNGDSGVDGGAVEGAAPSGGNNSADGSKGISSHDFAKGAIFVQILEE